MLREIDSYIHKLSFMIIHICSNHFILIGLFDLLIMYCSLGGEGLPIVCQPQAIFQIRPVNRCSAAISAHADSVLTVAFSLDGKHLASGSGDRTVRFWDITTQTPLSNSL
ncbi:hypothetical protein P8452_07500 [Trifolium repens]|nr:hypothetical protein P8452_07500 [Trifolium repens]